MAAVEGVEMLLIPMIGVVAAMVEEAIEDMLLFPMVEIVAETVAEIVAAMIEEAVD